MPEMVSQSARPVNQPPSITNVQSSPDVTVGDGWLVQLVSQDIAWDLDKAVAGTLSVAATAYTKLNTSTGFYNVNGDKFGSFAPGEAFGYYAVIWDAGTVDAAKNVFVTGAKYSSIAATGADKSLSFGNMTSTSGTSAFAGKEWTAVVPEPTSGLLMLLGMAGLALRRRRA